MDLGPAGSYYKLSAVDQNHNESAYALVGPGQTTSAPASRVAFGLREVLPNPATARAFTIRFALSKRGAAQLELVTVAGRVVLTREVGEMGIGEHTMAMGKDRQIPAGIYFIRLRQGTNEKSERVTILE